MPSILDIEPWVRCLGCGAPNTVQEEYLERYFKDSKISCSSCGKSLDWWQQVLREIQENFMGNLAFGAIGAQSVIFKIQLHPGQATHFKFTDYGVPINAKLVYVNYTSQGGGLFPLEMHGNVPIRHFIPNELSLWPIPLPGQLGDAATDVSILATWVPPTGEEDSWENLVDAFEAYAQGRHSAAVVPANTSVESELARLLTGWIEPVAGKDRTENFLVNAATYGHQLNVVLPLLISDKGLMRMPAHIRGLLNRLNGLRNDLVHRGGMESPLTQNEAAELLCAALFGFGYLRTIHRRL